MSFLPAGEARYVDMLPGVRRKLISSGDRVMAVRIELAKGSEVPLHSHPHEQIGFVLSGRLFFTIGDESKMLEAGDGYVIPSRLLHSVQAPEDSVAIDIFSPVREEYLSASIPPPGSAGR